MPSATRRGGDGRTVTCRTEGCQQVLAERWKDGSIKPLVIGAIVDPRGRLTITCPACGERNRMPEHRDAA